MLLPRSVLHLIVNSSKAAVGLCNASRFRFSLSEPSNATTQPACTQWKQLVASISLALLFLLPIIAEAGSYLPVESRLYGDLRLLEAEGAITTGMLTTLPISRREAARLTSEAAGNLGPELPPRIEQALHRLQREFAPELENGGEAYLKLLDTAGMQYAYSSRTGFFAQKNRDGSQVRKGNNLFLDMAGRFDSAYVGGGIKPEFDLHEDGADNFRLKSAYLLASLGKEELMFGKQSAWWGPAQNGSVLLSTNAEPLTSLKISNSVPYTPFGIGLRGTFFISRLEADRGDFKRPFLYGLKLDLKPVSFLEIDFARTAIFGGKGRRQDFGTFWDSLTGAGENGDSLNDYEPGDQRAGIDVKVVVPWRRQPMVLYMNAAGEDESNYFPSKWFTVFGLYLPRVLNLERVELLAEYADSTSTTWYTHHTYTDGYTYENRIIGHYVGGDAKDIYVQAGYHFDQAVLTLSYERLQKLIPAKYVWHDWRAGVLIRISSDTDLKISAERAWESERNSLVQLDLAHRF